MHTRLPLPVVLSAPGQRHAIPRATLSLPADGPFFRYLDSDDTRLPNHPYLNGRAADPAGYETYVGEDVWNEPGNTVHSSSCSSDDEGDGNDNDDDNADVNGGGGGRKRRVRHSELVFDDVVEWLVRTVDEKEWACDGVVVCGKYLVADDATWAVPSRSPTVYTPREAFMVMRCSCKFLSDIRWQRRDALAQMGAVASAGGEAGVVMAEFTLCKAMAGPAAKELRAFIPYRVTPSLNNATNVISDGPPQYSLSEPLLAYAGVCQRHTDVCFPSLMAWTETDHHNCFSLLTERIKKSRLLERTCEDNPAFLPALTDKWWQANARAAAAAPTPTGAVARHAAEAAASARARGFSLLVAVDLLFESVTLPIHLLSAKARLFPCEEEGDPPAYAGMPEAPFVLEPLDEDDRAADGDAAVPAEEVVSPQPEDASDNDNGNANDDNDGEEDEPEDTNSVNFFRLFRNEFNWNKYIEEMEGRWEDAVRAAVAHDAKNRSSEDEDEDEDEDDREGSEQPPPRAVSAAVLSDAKVARYCVVASDVSDLVTSVDTLTKRGLPLELMRPELLQGNEEGMAFLRSLAERLANEAR